MQTSEGDVSLTVKPELLAGPYEILELADGSSMRLAIEGFEEGTMDIKPRYPGAPDTKRIQALRLHVAPGYKPVGPSYWDVTSQTLIAQLRPHLKALAAEKKEFVITAHGKAPRKRFSLEI